MKRKTTNSHKAVPRFKLSEDMSLSVSVLLAAVIIIFAGNALGIFGSSDEKAEAAATAASTQVTAASTQLAPTVQSAPQTTAAPELTGTTAEATQSTVQNSTEADSAADEKTTAEIISIFNESANRVKAEAVKVVKNYEKRSHNKEHLIVPKVVEGMAADLMEENFKDDNEPIEYATREDIVYKYQVPGVEWSSKLTEAEVASAELKDTGSEYEITIKLHPSTNPEPGNGVAKAFDTITKSEVMESAPSFVTSFDTTYSDCVVKCRIDKATGRTLWSNYTSTVILAVKLNFLGKDYDAQVGMTFEKDYTVTY